MEPSQINTGRSLLTEANDTKLGGGGIGVVPFSVTSPSFRKPEKRDLSLNPRKERSSQHSDRKPLYLLSPGLLQRLPKCAPSCSGAGIFRRARQVPGCLLCASVCVIRDRDWIRDGRAVAVRWKRHAHYLYLPAVPARPSRSTKSPVDPCDCKRDGRRAELSRTPRGDVRASLSGILYHAGSNGPKI